MKKLVTITWTVPAETYDQGDWCQLHWNAGSGDIDWETPASSDRIGVLTGSAGDDAPVVTARIVVDDCGDYKFGFAVYDSLGNPHEGTPDEESEEIHVAADPPDGLAPESYNADTDMLVLSTL